MLFGGGSAGQVCGFIMSDRVQIAMVAQLQSITVRLNLILIKYCFFLLNFRELK